jgi:cytochrome b
VTQQLAQLRPVRVWDWPTRLCHWLLALAVSGAVVTAKVGGDVIDWHFRLGYLICALLLFRLLWGVVGGRWSRFSSFVRAPGTIWRYLRGQVGPHEQLDVGHNPLGSLSVLALLGLLLIQVGSGLIADDEIASTGPLVRFVANATSLAATSWHRTGGQWILIGLIGLHLAAIAYYRLHRSKDLVRPMLTGDKLLPADVPASSDGPRNWLLALLMLALSGAVVGWLVSLGE